MEALQPILLAAKENPAWGLFVFTLYMWWLQLKRNDKREEILDKHHELFVTALNNVKTAVEVSSTLLQAILNRRNP